MVVSVEVVKGLLAGISECEVYFVVLDFLTEALLKKNLDVFFVVDNEDIHWQVAYILSEQ
jgi:hypothetical protein